MWLLPISKIITSNQSFVVMSSFIPEPETRCFKRFAFQECYSCKEPIWYKKLFKRLRCYVKYLTWETDPTPVENFLGWIALCWAVAICINYNYLDGHFGALWRTIPKPIWITLMFIAGLMHVISPAFAMVEWMKKVRLIQIFVSGFLWVEMAVVSFASQGIIPFTFSCTTYALAMWWVFLRTGDGRPGSCRYLSKCGKK